MLKPTSEIDLIRGAIVSGTPFDMARAGERLIAEATDSLLSDRSGQSED